MQRYHLYPVRSFNLMDLFRAASPTEQVLIAFCLFAFVFFAGLTLGAVRSEVTARIDCERNGLWAPALTGPKDLVYVCKPSRTNTKKVVAPTV